MKALATAWLVVALTGCGDTTADLVTDPSVGDEAPPCGQAGCPAERPFCDETSGTCVGCRSRDDCTEDDALICDTTRGECVGCLTNLHCEEGEVCNAGLARCAEPCTVSTGCHELEEPICNETLGVCVECTSSMGCAAGTPCIRGMCGEEEQEQE